MRAIRFSGLLLVATVLGSCDGGTTGLQPGEDGGLDDGGISMGDAGEDSGPEICGPTPQPNTVIYVDATQPSGGNGSTWATAFNDLNEALAIAAVGQEVWVAEGTYRPAIPVDPDDVTDAERAISFVVPSGVALLGGFLSDVERECDRDPSLNVTVLSGDLNDDDTDTDDDNISDENLDDNSYNVLRLTDTTDETLVDGFTITGGYADGPSAVRNGGGILTDGGAPVFSTITLVDNHAPSVFGAGGGAASLDGNPTFRDVVFERNESSGSAGGLYVTGDGEVVVRDTRFVENRGVSTGGGVYVAGSDASIRIRDTIFEGNEVARGSGGNGNGGGMAVDAAGATISHTQFLGNTAEVQGGGINVRTGDVKMSHVVFADNDGGSTGGGIQASSGSAALLTVQYALMVRNVANNGGAIGGRRQIRISHATIVGNTARAGSGGAVRFLNNEGPGRVVNSILWGNTITGGGGIATQGNRVSVARSIVQDTGGSPWDGSPQELGSDGGDVLDIDPQFVDESDPEGPDGEWLTADDGLRLQTTSPAVDRGVSADINDIDQDGQRRDPLSDFGDEDDDGDLEEDLTTDIAGDARVVGAGIDLGAYENSDVAAANPGIIFVDIDAEGADDGTSWTDAYDNLQVALRMANQGDELWVAAGTYTPGVDRSDNFTLPSGVALYGGFSGTETMRSERDPDPETNGTVLSGEIGDAGNDDNIQHVVVTSGAGPDAILDGFEVTAGNDSPGGGGGFGGGIYGYGGAPTIENVLVTDNEAGTGGGAYFAGAAEPYLRNVVFQDNVGWQGGGMTLTDSRVEVVAARFEGNDGGSGGGGILNSDGRLVISHSVFRENESIRSGSSPGPGGGGIHTISGGETEGSQLVFVANEAILGGAVGGFNAGLVRLSNVTMVDNLGHRGGAVSSWNGSEIYLANSLLWANGLGEVREDPEASEIYLGTSGSSGGEVSLAYSIVDGGIDGPNIFVCDPRCTLTDDGNNGDGDPLFVDEADPDGADDTLGTDDDGLRLQAGSPAENTGTSEDAYDLDRDDDNVEPVPDIADVDQDDDRGEEVPSDVAGQPRTVGVIDRGAYER